MIRMMLAAVAAAVVTTGCATQQPTLEARTAAAAPQVETPVSGRPGLDARIAYHARNYNIPPALLHRVVKRESNYNPGARNGPYWGLMQIRYDTAQGMGYRGPASGLLDADTNLRFAGAYLANAYRIAGGNHDRAVRLYAGGYYYEAKRKGMLRQLITAQ